MTQKEKEERGRRRNRRRERKNGMERGKWRSGKDREGIGCTSMCVQTERATQERRNNERKKRK